MKMPTQIKKNDVWTETLAFAKKCSRYSEKRMIVSPSLLFDLMNELACKCIIIIIISNSLFASELNAINGVHWIAIGRGSSFVMARLPATALEQYRNLSIRYTLLPHNEVWFAWIYGRGV